MPGWMGALLFGSAIAAKGPPELKLEDGRPLRQTVHLELDPDENTTRGWTEIAVDLQGKRALLWVNAGKTLSLREATVDGEPAEVIRGDAQTVGLKFKKREGEVQVRLAFEGTVTDLDTQGLFRQEDGGERYLFTQFEPHSARDVFPCFDQPEHKIPWTIELVVPEEDKAFANAPAADSSVADGKRTTRFEATRPLPSYLVAFAAGPFEVVEGVAAEAEGGAPVRILVPAGRAEEAAWAAEITGPILDWQQGWFGRPYLYEKVDVVALPLAVGFGAMEHPGLITITSGLALAAAERDTPDRRRDYVAVMGHEFAHQWFGNQVTPAWWDDLWLNESFATWMEGRTTAGILPDTRPEIDRVAEREGAMAMDALASVRRVREPILALEDIESAFDGITYGKGGQILAMTEAHVGEQSFREGVRAYLDAHRDGVATAPDFVDAVSAAHGSDLSGIYADFLDQPGVPLVRAERVCEGEAALELTVERYLPTSRSKAEGSWRVPVCVRELDGAGKRSCTVLEGGAGRIPLSGPCDGPILMNDGMTGYYRSAMTAEELDGLLDSGALTVPETIGLIGDASAMVSKGELEPAAVLDALPELLALGEPRVTQATLDVAARLDDHLVPDDLRENYESFLRQTYGPLMEQVGLEPAEDESEDLQRLREDLVAVVGGLGRDPELIAAATERAEAWLEDETAVPPVMIGTILGLAARYGDLELYAALRTRARNTEDRAARATLLDALGSFRQQEAAQQNLEWAMSKELDIRESGPLFFGALSDRKLRPFAWDFTRQNIDELEKMLPGIARGYLIYSGSGFCEADRRDEVEAFFEARAKKYLGGRRILANVLEGIELCAATRERQQEEVRLFLERW